MSNLKRFILEISTVEDKEEINKVIIKSLLL